MAGVEPVNNSKAKCISSGLRHGGPFDPNVKVRFSGVEWVSKFMGDDHFSFLGNGLVKDISDSYAKVLVKQKFNSYTALIDGTLLPGIEKLWIWDNVDKSKVSWDFFIYDFPPSFVSNELQSIQNKRLKKWSGLAVLAEPSVLYQPRKDSDELLAEVKTGNIKEISSDGAGVGYGVRRKWSRAQDKHEGEREAMLCVFGELAKENRLVKVMSKPLEGDQVSTVLLHGKPDEKRENYFSGWLTWRECDVIGSKMGSDPTKARLLSEICIECCSGFPPNSQ